MKEIIIIGGGAAGLAAALAAAKEAPEIPIKVLEGQDRVGRKILATGNGRCNLTNLNIHPRFYHSESKKRLSAFLSSMHTRQTLDFFQSLGLYCTPDEAGRVYPACRQAAMVLDVLLLNLKRNPNIELITGCRVKGISAEKNALLVHTEDARAFRGGAVILATGGKAAPRQGSDGSGYALAAAVGHSHTALRPCLVPLKCKGAFLRSLKGIRVLCRATLYQKGKKCGAEDGEVQFTDYGLSGIPALQLSCRLTRDNEVGLDLFPRWKEPQLEQELGLRLRSHPAETVEDAMLGLLNKRVQYALLNGIALSPTAPARSVTKAQLSRLVRTLKDWRFPVIGTQGWEQAQVTAGGVSLDEVQEDFSSVFEPRLFLAGELLDAAGDCGGYNLHWAWCSGMEAGRAAAKLLNSQRR